MRENQVTSWAEKTLVPGCPGQALAGMWPTASFSTASLAPSRTGATSPSEGASSRPCGVPLRSGVVPRSCVAVRGEGGPWPGPPAAAARPAGPRQAAPFAAAAAIARRAPWMRAVPWTEESWRNHPSCATIAAPATMHAMLAAATTRCARGLPLIFSRPPRWPGSARARLRTPEDPDSGRTRLFPLHLFPNHSRRRQQRRRPGPVRDDLWRRPAFIPGESEDSGKPVTVHTTKINLEGYHRARLTLADARPDGNHRFTQCTSPLPQWGRRHRLAALSARQGGDRNAAAVHSPAPDPSLTSSRYARPQAGFCKRRITISSHNWVILAHLTKLHFPPAERAAVTAVTLRTCAGNML